MLLAACVLLLLHQTTAEVTANLETSTGSPQKASLCAVEHLKVVAALDRCLLTARSAVSGPTYRQRCADASAVISCAHQALDGSQRFFACPLQAFRHVVESCAGSNTTFTRQLQVSLRICADFEELDRLNPCVSTDCGDMQCANVAQSGDSRKALCYSQSSCLPLSCTVPCAEYEPDPDSGCPTCTCRCPQQTCSAQCIDGYQKDRKGCSTCQCNEGLPTHSCPKLECSQKCEYYMRDSFGCEVCECQCKPECCANQCSTGYQRGSDGCPTCECISEKENECPEPSCPLDCEVIRRKDERGCWTCACAADAGAERCPSVSCPSSCQVYKPNDEGCITCDCAQSPLGEQCVAQSCAACKHGYKYDQQRCQTCECNPHPCSTITCPEHMSCALSYNSRYCDMHGSTRAPCAFCKNLSPAGTPTGTPAGTPTGGVPAAQLGCPKLAGGFGACVQECDPRNVASCGDGKLCCSNGCGHTCRVPVEIDNIGETRTSVEPTTTTTAEPAADGELVCPPVTGFGVCVELCSDSQSCGAGLLCCHNGCGHVCRQPIRRIGGVSDAESSSGPGSAETTTAAAASPTEAQSSPTEMQPTLSGQLVCPSTEGMMGVCAEMCSSDAVCEEGELCCSNGCGHSCMQGVQKIVGAEGSTDVTATTESVTNACVECFMYCEFGKKLGADGCPLCECLPDPCESQTCGSSERCVLQHKQCARAPCPPVAQCKSKQQLIDLCQQPQKVGPCRALIPRFYYDTASGLCQQFSYGGCEGNYNNFVSKPICQSHCAFTGTIEPASTTPVSTQLVCPSTEGMMGVCVEMCSSDAVCEEGELCCSNGCGRACMQGVQKTVGTTPAEHNPCEAGRPLPKVFCGRGPTRQDCPSSYYCNIDPADAWAVCCPRPVTTPLPTPTRVSGQLVCPSTEATAGICMEQCSSNAECDQGLLCCSNGCGHVCMQGVHKTDETTTAFNPCEVGSPLPEVFCGLSPRSEACPSTHYCNAHPADAWAVCCPRPETTTTTQAFNPCPSGSPLDGVFCGRGPSRQDCPSSHYCEIDATDRYAVCCPAPETTTPTTTSVVLPCTDCTVECPFGREESNSRCPSCNCKPNPCESVDCSGEETCTLQEGDCAQPPCKPLTVCKGKAHYNEACQLPPEPGMCRAYFPRWYYDAAAGRCKQFVYGGCRGNQNNFRSRAVCEHNCLGVMHETTTPTTTAASVTSSAIRCPLCAISCKFGMPRGEDGCTQCTCNPHPCDATVCSDDSYCVLEPCSGSDCYPSATCREISAMRELCLLRAESGACQENMRRFAFSAESGTCQEFVYGGCGGNANSFETKERCEFNCRGITTTATSQLSTTPTSTTEKQCPVCEISCEFGMPRGADGCSECRCNVNPCATVLCVPGSVCALEDCVGQGCFPDALCLPKQEVAESCLLEPFIGGCFGNMPRFAYNSQSRKCEPFTYGGCDGNTNNYESRAVCEHNCRGVEPTTGPPPTTEPTTTLPATCTSCPTDPCADTSCPLFPAARCSVDACSCQITWSDASGVVNCQTYEALCERHYRRSLDDRSLRRPSCDPQTGAYTPLQCDATHCWCVNDRGDEVQGTRRSTSTLRPNCDIYETTSANFELRYPVDYSTVIPDEVTLLQFEATQKLSLASSFRLGTQQISHVKAKPGSIVVLFRLIPAAEAAPGDAGLAAVADHMYTQISQQVYSLRWRQHTLRAASVQLEYETRHTPGLSQSPALQSKNAVSAGLAVGIVLACLVLLALVVGVIVLVKSRRSGTHSLQRHSSYAHDLPPPNYDSLDKQHGLLGDDLPVMREVPGDKYSKFRNSSTMA